MDVTNSIIAGLVGTAVMTLFMYAITFLTHRVMKVVKILGTMLTFQTTPEGQLSDKPSAILVGTVAHLLVGVVFALIYYELWRVGVGQPNLVFGVVFGFVSGLAGILGWRIFFALHPKPPATVPLKTYLVTLLMAHVVFGVSVVLTYRFLTMREEMGA